MGEKIVSFAHAKAHLSELTEQLASGDEVVITKRGRPVGRLIRAERVLRPVDADALRELTARMAEQPQSAGEFMRQMRDQSRY
jgi:prevent-host-death family protein